MAFMFCNQHNIPLINKIAVQMCALAPAKQKTGMSLKKISM